MTSNKLAGQRGEGKIGAVVSLCLLAIGALFLWEYVPQRISQAEIRDFMVEQTKHAGKATPKALAKQILAEANRLGVPLDKKNLAIKKEGGRVKMKITYDQVLEFPGYTYVREVSEIVDRPYYNF